MDPTTQPVTTPTLKPSSKLPSYSSFPSKRWYLITFFGLVIISIIIVPILLLGSKKQVIQSPFVPDTPKSVKSWEIIFNFTTATQQLTVKSIRIKNAVSIKSPFQFSPYNLAVLDKDNQTLFENNIQINEGIHTDPQANFKTFSVPQIPEIESYVTVPYSDSAEKIQITKNGGLILELIPPKKISLNLIQEAQAANASCKPLNMIFISDNYSDMNRYHQDVNGFKQLYSSVAPYSNINLFNFKQIDNPISHPLGCSTGGFLNISCLNSVGSIGSFVFSQFPTLPTDPAYTKFIILVDAAMPTSGQYAGVLGATASQNGLGGQMAVFETRNFSGQVATHEVLGHAIGFLNDRYVSNNPNYGGAGAPPAKSNCSDNPQGEQFWKTIGYNSAFLGCTNNRWYGSSQANVCPNGNPGALINAGPTNSAMSAGGCSPAAFDPVEQEWIKTQILPAYSDVACLTAPSPIPSPSASPSRAPSPSPSASTALPSNSASPRPSPSPSVLISPSPRASTPPSAFPSTVTNASNPPSNNNGGIPGAENVPPGYYSDPNQPEDSPIPYICHQASPQPGGQQIQIGTLICTPK